MRKVVWGVISTAKIGRDRVLPYGVEDANANMRVPATKQPQPRSIG